MEKLAESICTAAAPWRLLQGEEAMSRIVVVVHSEEDRETAQQAVRELRAMFSDGTLFIAESLLGDMFIGSLDVTREFVASNGGWATPFDAN